MSLAETLARALWDAGQLLDPAESGVRLDCEQVARRIAVVLAAATAPQKCPRCGGTGDESPSRGKPLNPCPTCHGTGKVAAPREAVLAEALAVVVEWEVKRVGFHRADDLADLRARWQPVVEAWVNHETVTCANTERLLRDAIAKAVSNG